jgi:protein-tyrosine phosphatase
LPHFDDGAKNTEMSVAMLNRLHEQGVKTVVLTPHYYGKKSSPTDFIHRRNAMFDRIKAQIPEGMDVRLAAELHFTGFNMPENDELCKLAIEGTRYILVEFPFTTKWTGELLNRLYDFIRETDCIPIIAHAERYAEILKEPALLSEFADMGCYVQLTTGAFLDKTLRNFAFAALRQGLVHCLGTDAHDIERRPPRYQAAKETVYDAGYGEEWDRVQDIMQRLLAGETPKLPFGNVRKVFGFYR